MKKQYTAPAIDMVTYVAAEAMAEGENPTSWPFNDGDLGWT